MVCTLYGFSEVFASALCVLDIFNELVYNDQMYDV